jgi:hypothetical protein
MKPATKITLTNGEQLPFSFGMAALSNFLEAEGMGLNDLGDLQNQLSLSRIIRILHFGFADGHRRERVDYQLTVDDIGDLIDENPNLITECLEIFAKSMPAGETGNGSKAAKVRKVS